MTRPCRRSPRQGLASIAYVTIDVSNGAILRDISEGGLALQAVTPLHVHQEVRLRFQLPSPKAWLETIGRVRWSNSSGQAGIEFVGLSTQAARLLKDWLLTQLLTRAHHTYGCQSIFSLEQQQSLIVSGPARAPIPLAKENSASQAMREPGSLELPWIPFWFSGRILAAVVDGLILLAGLLLFTVLTLAMTHAIPKWPWSGLLALVGTVVFAGAYWVLFVGNLGFTPGMYLERIATRGDQDPAVKEEARTRFR